MNEMFRPVLTFTAAVSAMLGGCSPHRTAPEPPLAGASIGGPFTLTDQNGRTVSDRDFAGKYRIMYFGYTFCPDVCPTDMQHLGAAMRLLDRRSPALAKRVVPIFVTVDPARDTPGVLKQFVSAFSPRLVGLTGSPEAIARVAKEYRVFYEKQPVQPGGGYMIQHSDQAILFGPDGKPIVLVPVKDSPEAIVATLEQWVQ
ncbi:MAG TPA: SCO family protein [Sphingomonas sp.]|nr:SCO family protein [Sphingomonas sp.]